MNRTRRRRYRRHRIYGGGFNPYSLSGVVAWYSPLDVSTLYQDSGLTTPASLNDPVGGMLDKASLTYHQTQTSTPAKPTYTANAINGRPALVFDGGDCLLNGPLGALFSGSDVPFSIWCVAKQINTAANHCIWSVHRAASINPLISNQLDSVSDYRAERRDDALTVINRTGGTVDTNPHVIGVIFPGTTVSVYVDGTTVINTQAMDVGVLTLDSFAIGARRQGGSVGDQFVGPIGDLVVVNRAINASEAGQLTRYMGAQYGISVS
jgi:hypothetical protein